MISLVLVVLAQSGEFATWTDSEGVVHAALRSESPVLAKRVEATVSVIDPDPRPVVLPDGGTRADDTAWWRARLGPLRREVREARALELAAQQDVAAASKRQCVTATATTVVPARVQVFPGAAGAGKSLVVRTPATSNMVSNTSCVETSASPAQRAVLAQRHAAVEEAERALRELEAQATAAGLPLRDLD